MESGKPYNVLTLEFKVAKLRNEYNQISQTIYLKYNILISILALIYCLFITVTAETLTDLLLYIFASALIMAIIIGLITYKKARNILLWILQILYSFLEIFFQFYILKDSTNKQLNQEIVDAKKLLEQLATNMIISYAITFILSKWYLKAAVFAIGVESCFFFNANINQSSSFFFHIVVLLILSAFYWQEKLQKDLFYNFFIQKQELLSYKKLIDQQIPCEICVLSKSDLTSQTNVVCVNQGYLNKFNIDQTNDKIKNQQVLEVLSKIQIQYSESLIDQEQQDKKQQGQPLNILHSAQNLLKNTSNIKTMSNASNRFQFVKKQRLSRQTSNDLLYNRNYLNCEYIAPTEKMRLSKLSIYEDNALNKLYFDVKLTTCIWDNKKSIIIMLDDVSQQLMQQRLSKYHISSQEIIYNQTGKLKNYLNAILLNIQALKYEKYIPFHIYENIQDIEISGFFMDQYINSIQFYTKINEQDDEVQISEFQINNLMNSIMKYFQQDINSKLTQLNITFLDKVDQIIIKNDFQRLRFIFMTLIFNAIKHTIMNQPIKIKFRRYDLNVIQMQVINQGHAITPDQIKEIFNYPYKLVGKSKEFHTGLSLCYQLVKLIGPEDKIFIQSEINKEIEFKFFFYIEHIQKRLIDVTCVSAHQKLEFNGSWSLINKEMLLLKEEISKNIEEENIDLEEKNQKIQNIPQLQMYPQINNAFSVPNKISSSIIIQSEELATLKEFLEFLKFQIKPYKLINAILISNFNYSIRALKKNLSYIDYFKVSIVSTDQEAIVQLDQYNKELSVQNKLDNQRCIQLIIIDFETANFNAIEIAQKIRTHASQQESQQYELYIILQTEFIEQDIQELAMIAGIHGCCIKPLSMNTLFFIIKNILLNLC